MRLSSLVPLLPVDLVTCLENCGIRTDADLLFSGTVLDIFQRLPAGTISLYELTNCLRLVAKMTSATGICAVDLLSPASMNQGNDDFLSDVPELDELLGGGFGGSRILEISGDRASGKTASSNLFSIRACV
jgi:RecA/RadA recombinase